MPNLWIPIHHTPYPCPPLYPVDWACQISKSSHHCLAPFPDLPPRDCILSQQGQVINFFSSFNKDNPHSSQTNNLKSFITRIHLSPPLPTSPAQAHVWTSLPRTQLYRWKRTMQLPEGAEGEPATLVTKETSWLPNWVGKTTSLGLPGQGLYIKRSKVTRHCLIWAVLRVTSLNPTVCYGDEWEEVFCL